MSLSWFSFMMIYLYLKTQISSFSTPLFYDSVWLYICFLWSLLETTQIMVLGNSCAHLNVRMISLVFFWCQDMLVRQLQTVGSILFGVRFCSMYKLHICFWLVLMIKEDYWISMKRLNRVASLHKNLKVNKLLLK